MKNKLDLKSSLLEVDEFNQQPKAAKPSPRKDKSELANQVSERYGSKETRKAPAAKPKSKPKPIKRVQVVRDNITYPPSDGELLDKLIIRAARIGARSNKSEVVRGGIHTLAKLSDSELAQVLLAIPRMKPGRSKALAKSSVESEE